MTVPRRQLDRAGTALEPLSTRKRWEKRSPLIPRSPVAEQSARAERPRGSPVTDALRLLQPGSAAGAAPDSRASKSRSHRRAPPPPASRR
ncbi:hypothetical protein MTO96_002607 [Rhipicephalus appendiculatus]